MWCDVTIKTFIKVDEVWKEVKTTEKYSKNSEAYVSNVRVESLSPRKTGHKDVKLAHQTDPSTGAGIRVLRPGQP